jgi:hypothetical protein
MFNKALETTTFKLILKKEIIKSFFQINNIELKTERDYSKEEYLNLLNNAKSFNHIFYEFIKCCFFEERENSYHLFADYDSYEQLYDYFLSFVQGYNISNADFTN